MTDNTEEKQIYLRDNILNNGYDGNEFVQFLQSKKGEAGADISNWSMEDLKIVVKEFITKVSNAQNKINTAPQPQPQPQPQQIPQNIEEKPEPKPEPVEPVQPEKRKSFPQTQKIKIPDDMRKSSTGQNEINDKSKEPRINDVEFGVTHNDYFPATKIETTELSKYNLINLKVSDPQKVEGGFFSRAYLTYLITTTPINITTRRRYSDFLWFRETLATIFHTSLLPYIPRHSKVLDAEKGEYRTQKIMKILERFLNYLAQDPIIKYSQIFYDFISIEKEEEFNTKKKTYEKIKTPVNLQHMKSYNGDIHVEVNPEKNNYFENIKENIDVNETLFNKLKENLKLLKGETDAVSERLRIIGIVFKKLFRNSEKYLDDNTIIESYRQMSKMFSNWSETIKKQGEFFRTEVKEYFSYVGHNFVSLKELTHAVDSHKATYSKASKNLINKKIDLFRKGDPTKWDLNIADKASLNTFIADRVEAYKKICFKETQGVIHLKQEYGYYLNRLINEYERLRYINGIVHKENIIKYSKVQSDFVSGMFTTLSDIISTIDNCNNPRGFVNECEVNQDPAEDRNNIMRNAKKPAQQPVKQPEIKKEEAPPTKSTRPPNYDDDDDDDRRGEED